MKTTLDLTDPRHLSPCWNKLIISLMKKGMDQLQMERANVNAMLPLLLNTSDYNGYEHYSDLLEQLDEAICRLDS